MSLVEPGQVQVTCRGAVGTRNARYAREKVSGALRVADRPVLYTHVVLDWRPDPAVQRPARAEVTVDLEGRPVRAVTAALTVGEAVDELEDRLRRRLLRLQGRSRDRHRRPEEVPEGEWRHGDPARRPTPYHPRPVKDRQVIRRHTLASRPMTPAEAVEEMDDLDHDFLLFTDRDSGTPGLVRRPGDAAAAGAAEGAAPAPPRITDDEARHRLEVDGETFVFYLDRDTGEGRVLYLRHDGHYGLVATD